MDCKLQPVSLRISTLSNPGKWNYYRTGMSDILSIQSKWKQIRPLWRPSLCLPPWAMLLAMSWSSRNLPPGLLSVCMPQTWQAVSLQIPGTRHLISPGRHFGAGTSSLNSGRVWKQAGRSPDAPGLNARWNRFVRTKPFELHASSRPSTVRMKQSDRTFCGVQIDWEKRHWLFLTFSSRNFCVLFSWRVYTYDWRSKSRTGHQTQLNNYDRFDGIYTMF